MAIADPIAGKCSIPMPRRHAASLILLALLGGLAMIGAAVSAGPATVALRPMQCCPPPAPPLAVPTPEPLPPPTPVPEAATAPEDPPTPVVAIRVRVPATTVAGKDLEYKICVENCADAPAHHVLVRNPLPANARFVRASPEPSARAPELQWNLGTLKAGERRIIRLVLAASGQGDVNNCARVQFEHGQCVRTKILRPALVLHKEGPTEALVGQTLSYHLTVTNSGAAPAAAVVLTDRLATGLEHASGHHVLSWQVGALAPGQSRTFDYQAVARAPGRLCNEAVATAAGDLLIKTESCVSVGEAKLSLTKTGPTGSLYLSQTAAYRITLTNAGTLPLSAIQIADPLPAGMSFVSASAGGQLVGSQVQWSAGPLEPGATRTVDVVLRSEQAGRVCNRVTATAPGGVSAQAEACTEFVGAAGLVLEVVDTDDPVEVGGETSYIINVRNQGQILVTNLIILADVPTQLAVVRVTGPSDHAKDGQRISFAPMTLKPKAVARFIVYVKALAPGDVRFKVDMAADQLPSGPVHEEESTTLYRDLPDGGAPAPGGPLEA